MKQNAVCFRQKCRQRRRLCLSCSANAGSGVEQVEFDPLQCVMDFKRNFPLDILAEAQAAQAMINAGMPKRVAYSIAFSCIDDIESVMQLIEEEQNSISRRYSPKMITIVMMKHWLAAAL